MTLNSGFNYIELLTFYGLLGFVCLSSAGRQFLKTKPRFEWLLDITNLLIQGLLVPFVQLTLLFKGLQYLAPQYQGVLTMPFWAGFLLNFVFVDYLYYWNHRVFHFKSLFPVHIVHHTVRYMDVMATSKNTLWTTFFIVYLWVNGLFLYLTDLNMGFLLAMSVSAALDIWKHSTFLSSQPKLHRWISKNMGIMTPLDHAWHHAQKLNSNFGANWSVFDKWHGTYEPTEVFPERLGVNSKLTAWQKLVYPFHS